MKKIIIFLLICIFFISYSSVTFAKEDRTGNFNFSETTGLINMPTARTIKVKTGRIAIRMAKLGKYPPIKHKWQVPDPGPATGTPFDSDWWIWSDGDRQLLLCPFKNIEVSLMNIHSYQISPVISAKWVAFEEKKGFPSLAVGVNNIFKYKEDINYRWEVQNANSKITPFLVASKRLGKDEILDLSVGFGGGKFRNRIFCGGELFFDKKHLLSAVGEYDGNIYSYGLKYRLPGDRWDFSFVIQDKNQPGFTFAYTIPW